MSDTIFLVSTDCTRWKQPSNYEAVMLWHLYTISACQCMSVNCQTSTQSGIKRLHITYNIACWILHYISMNVLVTIKLTISSQHFMLWLQTKQC